MQEQEVDVAQSTRSAWRNLHEQLAERLELLGPGEGVRLEAPAVDEDRRMTPFVSIRREGDRFVAETPGDRALDVSHRIGDRGRRQLRALGWCRGKADRHYRFEADHRYVDQVAHLCIASLRDVHGVLHPAFLEGDLRLPEDPSLLGATAWHYHEPPVVAFPTNRPELEVLVRATLSADLEHPVKVDEDGDFPFTAGTAVVFVRVLGRVPVIRLFAELVIDVVDTNRAAREVERLNREHREVKFLLLDDRIHCERDLDAWPFAPQHLRSALNDLCELTGRIDREVAERVGGRCFLAPPDHPPDFPSDLELLLSGDPLRSRPRAELISMVCGHDVAQLRRWLRRAYVDQEAAADKLQEAVLTGRLRLVRARERDYRTSTRRYRRLTRALRYALRQPRSAGA